MEDGRKPDFSGYATKAGLLCTDGRTITPEAFAHQDGLTVPLAWSHKQGAPANILGHGVLSARPDGMWVDAYFNETTMAKDAKELVRHGDIRSLSILANQLEHRGSHVVKGQINEVSLVVQGANPGAFIEEVSLAHSINGVDVVDAIIYADQPLELSDELRHSASDDEDEFEGEDVLEHSNQEIFDSLTDEQREFVGTLLGDALKHSASNEDEDEDNDSEETDMADEVKHEVAIDESKTVQEILDSFSPEQLRVVEGLIGQGIENALAAIDDDDADDDKNDDTKDDSAEHSAADEDNQLAHAHQEGNTMTMKNAFDEAKKEQHGSTLSHNQLDVDQLEAILGQAKSSSNGSTLHESFLAHAGTYGIDNIDLLFPDFKTLQSTPEFLSRRMEWVSHVWGSIKRAPFTRIKSVFADITTEEARARGYVTGDLKKDEVFKLLDRKTTPQTIYKKQKLDRDDILDITDIDIIVWLKAEMRIMLDEEIAGAILIGDGREVDSPDKIKEDHLRPIASDHEMYAHPVNVASNTEPRQLVKTILRSRKHYKGSGTPTLYTTDDTLTDLILIEDRMGRRLYETEQSLAAALRVKDIVVVEVFDRAPDVMAIIVNLLDYTVGADRGGAVTFFEDFDIDFNQQKYLLETRISGALTKAKSALVFRRTAGTVVTAEEPTFDNTDNTLTIPTVTGVQYRIDDQNAAAGDRVITEGVDVTAHAKAGYQLADGSTKSWSYEPV
jgi:hypothetical protein